MVTQKDAFLYEQLLETHVEMATGAETLLPEFYKLHEDAPDKDPALVAFYGTVVNVLTDLSVPWHAELWRTLDSALKHRERQVPAKVAANIFQRTMQWQALIEDPENFPGPKYETAEGWLGLLKQAVEDPIYKGQLEKTMREFTIQSVLERRFPSHKMVMLSEHERIGRNPTYLEVGCSGQLGQRWLASGLPAHYMEVLSLPEAKSRRETLQRHPYLTRFISNYLKHELKIGTNWGIDEVPLDEETLAWQYFCSVRPNELKDPAKHYAWERLIEADIPGVNFYNAQFSREGMKNFTKETGMKHFNIVTFPTMLHQVDPDLRQETIELGQEYVDPNDGYLLIQDFAMVDLYHPDRPRFFDNWHKAWGTYRLLLADPREDFKKLHEIAIFDGGRANQMIFGRDIGKLAMIGELSAVIRKNPDDAAQYFRLVRDIALPL